MLSVQIGAQHFSVGGRLFCSTNCNLTRSREKEATAKQAFTFPGASLTEPQVAQRATADAKRLGSGSVFLLYK